MNNQMANSLDEIKIKKDLIAKKYEFQKFLFKNNLNTGMPNFLAKRLEDSKNYLGYVRAIDKGEVSSVENFAHIWQEISKMDSCQVILPISEYFTIEDELYLFQSPPKGNKNLKICLQEKRAKNILFSTEETLSILLSILDSLCQLHANGIIHGEINPEYIFWHEPDEKVMLLGLGTFKNSCFSTPNILNKRGYSAPEQQKGTLQEQSDLYALGMLGLCLLTGISADDFSVIDGQLDLTQAQADIFMPVFNWLKQAVELNIENRFQTALEMRQKLGDCYEMYMGEKLPPINIQIIPIPPIIDPPDTTTGIKEDKDYTKYTLDNGTKKYSKNRLVLAVVTEYVKQNPQLTLQELQNIFPKSLLGNDELIVELSIALEKVAESEGKYKRHFINDDEILLDANHVKMAVNSQWGKWNIDRFIDKARELGFKIEQLSSPSPEGNPKYILRLRTRENLAQILQEGKSGAWRVAEYKDSQIKNVEVYNWDGTEVVKGIFDAKLSYREPNDKGYPKLFVVFTNGSLETVSPPLKWNGQNSVQYEPITDI